MARHLPHHIVWPGLVVVMLGGSVLTGVVTMTLATGDPSFAIEPDYYERALAWDEDAARRRASESLGWSADTSLATSADALGNRVFTVTLIDRDGQPIDDARVSMTAFHKASSAERETFHFDHTGQGVYVTQLSSPRDGAWQIDLVAARHDDTFLDSRQFWVFPTP